MATVKECTCGAMGALYGQPHEQGCPRYRDRSKSKAVIDVLERRYGDAEWLFFTEAWFIDALAVRTWASGIGHRRIAFEVKVSRADFLAELRKPEKRQNALDLSHQFFFVTPKGLVDKSEVPPECGLMIIDGERSRIVKQAPIRQPRPLKLTEAVYLMRAGLYRTGIMQLRGEVLREQSLARGYEERADYHRDEAERAKERLVALNSHLIERGSVWRGRWQRYSWDKSQDNVECYVERIIERSYGMNVTLRKTDGSEVMEFVRAETLLTYFERLDVPRMGVLGAVADTG